MYPPFRHLLYSEDFAGIVVAIIHIDNLVNFSLAAFSKPSKLSVAYLLVGTRQKIVPGWSIVIRWTGRSTGNEERGLIRRNEDWTRLGERERTAH
jgi:hypothetical protein